MKFKKEKQVKHSIGSKDYVPEKLGPGRVQSHKERGAEHANAKSLFK